MDMTQKQVTQLNVTTKYHRYSAGTTGTTSEICFSPSIHASIHPSIHGHVEIRPQMFGNIKVFNDDRAGIVAVVEMIKSNVEEQLGSNLALPVVLQKTQR
jgi:hypothetical protein